MGRFFKISKLSKASGVNLETIRHYEKLGLITPAQRQENGYRIFGEKTTVTAPFYQNLSFDRL